MTRLYDDPTQFADEAAEGFVSSHRRWARTVPGGVVSRVVVLPGQVAVVVGGGGSGHYPAFAARIASETVGVTAGLDSIQFDGVTS